MNAADILRIKELLPTSLGTEEIRERYAREILQRSVFSAKMESMRYLARIRELCARLVNGDTDQATVRAALLDELERMGHSPQDGGGITNPASVKRINLIMDTQRGMAASVANIVSQTGASVEAFPAWELTRAVGKRVPRIDWDRRWAAAGNSVGWEGAVQGEYIALKSSPIWQALGDGAGGYKDTLGNPYPPFAFSSGMGWVRVERERCIALGLIEDDEKVEEPDMPQLSPNEKEIAETAERLGFSIADFDMEDFQ